MLEYARTVVKIRMYKAYYNLVHTEKEINRAFVWFIHVPKFELSLELDIDFLFCFNLSRYFSSLHEL